MMFRLSAITTAVLLVSQSAATILKRYDTLKPFYTHDSETPADCTLWWNSDDGMPCETVLLFKEITVKQLTAMNPTLNSCSDWKLDFSYCIKAPSIPNPVTSTITLLTTLTSTPMPSPTKPSNGIQTPQPLQPGMVTNCNNFYKVPKGNTCQTIATKGKITIQQLITWNTQLGGVACTNLLIDHYICAGVISTTPTPTPSPTKSSNGIQTPQPIQPGMVSYCNNFYKVPAGNTCETIANKGKITVAQLAAWNTQIGGIACTNLWLDYYICTGVIGTAAPTTTKPSNGIKTPSPIIPGMVTNCDNFYKVPQGSTCNIIATKGKITVAQIVAWNKQIGGLACTGLLADYYLCTGIIGDTPPPPNPTPQPIQAGMVSKCKKFHFVKSGQACNVIATQYKITLANFIKWNPAVGSTCTGLWTNTYACVGL